MAIPAEAAAVDGMSRPPKPCKYCQVPVAQPKRWDMDKDFCSPKHRTAWHAQERRKEVQAVLANLDDLGAELERMQAVVGGAMARIRATLPKERTKKKT